MTDWSRRSPLATPSEVAEYRRTTVDALAQERHAGTGPPYIKAGRRVLYEWAAIEKWLVERTVGAA